ncbi:MAG TPA: response regulator [Chloroflexota bacterium]|nr:response regulator [Chloroflexota bacterium]
MTRIAVVNDDTVFLDMMAAVLEEQGWRVTTHREGDKAYDELKADPPHLIILDIRMESPETGWNVLELLTLDRELRHIPVIVCSAAVRDLREHQDWLMQNGISVLPKPFNLDQLYETVNASLSPHRGDA